ncbi:MAG: nitroreductase family protein [Lachnospiraceae bacterium]|nr:nitroreductase family protein [Lachnospiraceae bacterium]
MEFNELVELRRSVRAFEDGVNISQDEIEEMIECALQAPTWKNSETGRYYVANTKETVERVRMEALPEFNRNSTAGVSTYIVTTFEANRSGFERDGSANNELGNEWGAYDLGLQNQLMILKARELGYDTLIMGIRDEAALRNIFDIPSSQHVVAVIAVGKRAAEVSKPPRKEIEKVASFK